MKLLVLGGTGWLSGQVARLALEAGHQVTCVSRGVTGALPGGTRPLRLDRTDAASDALLAAEDWDAAVDVSSQPGLVRRAVNALTSRCRHFVYVSSASVYAQNDVVGADERAVQLRAFEGDSWTDMAHYGAAKVACEQHVIAAFGANRCTVARAGLIGGPGDHTDRSGYWPLRFWKAAQAKQAVLVPDAPAQRMQLIDVRDLAAWLLHCAEGRVAGTFNAMGESLALCAFMQAAQTVAGFQDQVVSAPEDWLVEQGVTYWAGPKSFPLWVPSKTHQGFGSRDTRLARENGLQCRDTAKTLHDALAWEQSRDTTSTNRRAGLGDADEQALLSLWAAEAAKQTER